MPDRYADALAFARTLDPDAECVDQAPDCLLVDPAIVPALLERYPDGYEDPNEPGETQHTRFLVPAVDA